MALYVCENCGAEFQDDSRRHRRCCSEKCNRAWHVRSYREKKAQEGKPWSKPEAVPCSHNTEVFCRTPELCATCGWNPAVAVVRRDEILKRMGVVMP